MAEESPRPPTDEEEEGEEAAEAPLMEEVKKEVPVLEVCKAEAAKPEEKPKVEAAKPEEKPKPEVKKKEAAAPVKASPPRAAPKPLLPSPRAFSHPVPAVLPALPQPYYPAAPAYPSAAAATTTAGVNLFANDGSFLELFKKKMEEKPAGSREEAASPEEEKKPEADKRRPISFVGKRRGGAKLALKTGMVAKKPKTDEEEVVVQKGGAWAQYMAEVKKYKAHQCSDDDKTRPLVK